MKNTKFAHAYITLIICVGVTVTGKAVFEKSLEIDLSKNFSGYELGTSKARSTIECSVTCYMSDDCRSYLINHDTGECKIYMKDLSDPAGGPQLSEDSFSYYREKAIDLVAGRGQYSWQSSLYGPTEGLPHLALDGNTSPFWDSQSCMHTNQDGYPWWAVDIGSSAKFRKIVIYQRKDRCCVQRFGSIKLLIADRVADVNDLSGHVIATYNGPASKAVFPIIIDLATVARGRYLQMYKDVENDELVFCEIQVFSF